MSGFNFDSEYPKLCRYASGIARGLGMDESEGVAAVHDTWIKMANGAESLGEQAGAFHRAVCNHLIDKWRRDRRLRSLDQSSRDDSDFSPSEADRLLALSDRIRGRRHLSIEDALIGLESLNHLFRVATALQETRPKLKAAFLARLAGAFGANDDNDGLSELRDRYGLEEGGFESLADLARSEGVDLNTCAACRATRGADELEKVLLASGIHKGDPRVSDGARWLQNR